jgi:hypothetical protein
VQSESVVTLDRDPISMIGCVVSHPRRMLLLLLLLLLGLWCLVVPSPIEIPLADIRHYFGYRLSQVVVTSRRPRGGPEVNRLSATVDSTTTTATATSTRVGIHGQL